MPGIAQARGRRISGDPLAGDIVGGGMPACRQASRLRLLLYLRRRPARAKLCCIVHGLGFWPCASRMLHVDRLRRCSGWRLAFSSTNTPGGWPHPCSACRVGIARLNRGFAPLMPHCIDPGADSGQVIGSKRGPGLVDATKNSRRRSRKRLRAAARGMSPCRWMTQSAARQRLCAPSNVELAAGVEVAAVAGLPHSSWGGAFVGRRVSPSPTTGSLGHDLKQQCCKRARQILVTVSSGFPGSARVAARGL